jgi:hypothetical protein
MITFVRPSWMLTFYQSNIHIAGTLSKTILKKWHIKCRLISLLKKSHNLSKKVPASILKCMKTYKKDLAGTKTENAAVGHIDQPFFNQWLSVVQPPTDAGLVPTRVSPQVQFQESTIYKRKSYSVQRRHIGNSTIQFQHQQPIKYGCIDKIFTSSQFGNRVFLIVLPYEELDKEDINSNPYQKYPDVNRKLVYPHLTTPIVIDVNMVISRAALLINPPATFHVARGTCCMVGLASVVSHFRILFDLFN